MKRIKLIGAFAFGLLCIQMSPVNALDPVPMNAQTEINDNISGKLVDRCAKVLKGEDKALCQLSAASGLALAFCKRSKFKVGGLGKTKCYDFISEQLNNLAMLAAGNVPMPKTFEPIQSDIPCYREWNKKCYGYVQEFVGDAEFTENLYLKIIKSPQKKALNTIGSVGAEQAAKAECTKVAFTDLINQTNFGQFIKASKSPERDNVIDSLALINDFMFPGGGGAQLILDLQGIMTKEGKFLVIDPDGVLKTDKPYEPSKGQIAYCWHNFMQTVLEYAKNVK
ncbi:hypothetical protein SAMN04488518_11395 [Pseudovibrio ascidiaceicola]|uniref:Lipoprotein n=1 Tax=Pseudovibrio ascidiaceicola TaxID=285279 RepID=A0A1I4DZZ6_9HYPH|nr:hypothetical protein [Pseudovibrio ascidiaceicola]SFK99055.1 hypothetical protein SAMN04488518_11395 [Pseudovibrio ascidiaceicola]